MKRITIIGTGYVGLVSGVGISEFGQHVSIALDNKTHNRLYIPPGFAHGYYVLSETAVFQYKCTDYYRPQDEYGINWNDPGIGINWKNGDKLVSEKDNALPNLEDLDPKLLPPYSG